MYFAYFVYANSSNSKTVDSYINQFKEKCRQGAYYIFCTCNRILYEETGLKPNANDSSSQDILNVQLSLDGYKYVNKTCPPNFIQGGLPCQTYDNDYL